jgi:hypothetical protein
MREIVIRLEVVDRSLPDGPRVRGSVVADGPDRRPRSFDGWLQLLGLVEALCVEEPDR